MPNLKRNITNSSSSIGGGLFGEDVRKVDPRTLRPHPENTYSMDKEELDELMQNIESVGLIEWPLVREVDDGGLQILSGHRRAKACSKLADKYPEEWGTISVRVAKNISDEDALVILHSGNISRDLPRAERIKQFEYLNERVAEMREHHPEWTGVRTNEIIATILGYGSEATYKRQKAIVKNLPDGIYDLYDRDILTDEMAYKIATKDEAYREELEIFLGKKNPQTREEAKILIAQYDKGAGEYIKEMQHHITQADVALFRAREILRQKNVLAGSDKERLWDIRNTVDKMLKGTRRS